MSVIKQTFKEVQSEAKRCLYCVDPPCQKGCPASVDCAQFIRHLRYGDIKSAKKVIMDANPLGNICGILCPYEELCQKNCTMQQMDAPIHIRDLQRFSCENADYVRELSDLNGKKVAVVGAGPAGLGCAATLAALGYEVDIFEKGDQPAGVVATEIPDTRISAEAIARDVEALPKDRVHFHFGQEVAPEDITGKLSSEYQAVFVAVGLSVDRMSGVDIEEGAPVEGCSGYLRRLKENPDEQVEGNVLVIGGGDSAIDAVTSSLIHGAEKATLAYRRSKEEMPANDEEFFYAAGSGVELMYMVSPVKIACAEGGCDVTFVQNRLVEKPGEARKGFEAVPGSEYVRRFSKVIFSIGKAGEEGVLSGTPDELTLRIGQTNVFAGGDYVSGGATIVAAVADGKRAAYAIDGFLK